MSAPASASPAVTTRRTALVLVVPEAQPLVGAFRARHHAAAVARGVPPHVTVLVPFVPPEELDDLVRSEVRVHAAGLDAFDAEITHVATFSGHVWLAPAPRERFVALIRSTYTRFPEHPPYGGDHVEPEPHLTVGQADSSEALAAVKVSAERELAPGLPVRFRVEALTLLEEGNDGVWRPVETFPLDGG
jgi:2'-5' RNA ligase superfamily protein